MHIMACEYRQNTAVPFHYSAKKLKLRRMASGINIYSELLISTIVLLISTINCWYQQ